MSIVNVHPVAVPVFVMSLEVKPEMFSLKFNVKTGEPVVGVAGAVPHETVGAVVSDRTMIVEVAVAGPRLPARSLTTFALRFTST